MTQRKSFEIDIETVDDTAIARTAAPSLAELWSRRSFLKTAGGIAILATASTSLLALAACERKPAFGFKELPRGVDENHHVAEGHDADILIRWGDPVLPDAPVFDPMNQSADAQSKQFGYNNDYVGFVPLPYGADASDRGLLCVNHEYTNAGLMFPGFTEIENATPEQIDVTMAAQGASIVEIARGADGKWKPVADGRYNRRITALGTEIEMAGPAAGHERLRTGADPEGRIVIGTLNNCAGGVTPWGTYLMGEENVNIYFAGSLDGHPEAANYKRMGIPGDRMGWARFHNRFDINAEPNEANRFGWIVEADPLDPASRPKKRTALGRFKHEGCETVATKDGHLAVYMGDDQQFEYLYKFVSRNKIASDRAANANLLDEGTLYVARFADDGTGAWKPLTHGANGLDASNGFASQADVLIETRRAADLLGATPLDRPEDVQPNPLTHRVYVALTNNDKRTAVDAHGANPRADNLWGQIVELTPEGDDHASQKFTWTILVACGNPKDAGVKAQWNAGQTSDGWFSCPDNLAVDALGRLWVATDQGKEWSGTSGAADGIFALETAGETRGLARRFFQVPVGAEMCGPCFTPNARTLFVAVQHPGADGTKEFQGFRRASTFEDPATRWPDFKPDMPPRPSVVAITSHKDGPIGG
ncbi:MAG: PhoX family phosphatase [Parvibaculum sp.]|uniref:PhoX family protein n=1 Tax=Parvibaculum sp. TaxID=2024848 RepID=UPI0025E1536C|nr:PhoX family phosphatase [Parvibaculum sp.]MCE9651284.1 PhoX family phosphatase [Parvibaculum sp.]